MRKILTLLTFSAVVAPFALMAESWSGPLLDASCYDRQYQQQKDMTKAADACMATSATTSFAVHASGRVLKLDSSGNSKAMTAFKNRADRSAPGQTPKEITAKVEGTESGGTIKVETIDVQ